MHLLPQEGILVVAVAITVILLIAILATSPIQAMVKLLVNSMAAVMLLCFISIVGEYWGIHLPINPVTILLIAILGLPGLLLVAMLYFIFI